MALCDSLATAFSFERHGMGEQALEVTLRELHDRGPKDALALVL